MAQKKIQPAQLALATVASTGSYTDLSNQPTISGTNTGDETTATIKTKLGITTLSGSNTGDQTNVTGTAGTITGSITESQVTNLTTDLAAKQATLVSGTNIKTVNGTTLLGSGDITITGGAGNVVGPGTSVANNISTFSDTTGALLKDSGISAVASSSTVATITPSSASSNLTVAASGPRVLTLSGTNGIIMSVGASGIIDVNLKRISNLLTTPTSTLDAVNQAYVDSGATTLTNKRITQRIGTTTSSATPAINTDSFDNYNLTAQAAAITSWSITGTPTDHQELMVRIKATGSFAIAAPSNVTNSGIASFPTTTVSGKTISVGLRYDSAAAKWIALAVDALGY